MSTNTKWTDEDRAKQKKFLDRLRDSGRINMWGCCPYIVQAFNVTEKEASEIFAYWMDSFKKEAT